MFTRSTGVMPYSTHVKRTRWLANTTSNSLDGFDGGAGKDYVLRGIRSFTQYTTWCRNWGFVEANSHAFIDQYYPQARREADANVIDAGAGLDTVLGGWGDDVIDGGDELWSDAPIDDTPLSAHGDDHLDGDTGAERNRRRSNVHSANQKQLMEAA